MNRIQSKKPLLQMSILNLNHRSLTTQKPTFDKKASESRFSLNTHLMKYKGKYNMFKGIPYSAYLAELKKQVYGCSFILKGSSLRSNKKFPQRSMVRSVKDEQRDDEKAMGSNIGQTTNLSEYLAPNFVESHASRDKSYKRDRIIFSRSSSQISLSRQQDTQKSSKPKIYQTNYQYPIHQSKDTYNRQKSKIISSRAINIRQKQKNIFTYRTDPSENINSNEAEFNLFRDKNIFEQISKNCITLKENMVKKNEVKGKKINRSEEQANESIKNTKKYALSIFYTKKHPFQTILTPPRRKTYVSYSNSSLAQI